MNQLLKFLLLITILASSSCSKKEIQPNIVFIMSDDHAFQAVSAYGHNLNNTPNIDRIAEEGAIFNKGFVTNSICAPSRAVMLTGKHSFINGKVDNVQPFNWDQSNFAKDLQNAGYETALIGKIHLKGKPQGFNHWSVLPGQGHYYNPKFIENGDTIQIEGHVTPITTKMTLDWLKNTRDKEKPFLLLYHQKAPHRNWMTEEKYLTLFDDKTFEPPFNYYDNYEGNGTAAKEQEMQASPSCCIPSGMQTDDHQIRPAAQQSQTSVAQGHVRQFYPRCKLNECRGNSSATKAISICTKEPPSAPTKFAATVSLPVLLSQVSVKAPLVLQRIFLVF